MAEHNLFGREAEKRALDYLTANDYILLRKNYRFRKAEVDIFNTLQETEKFGDIRIKACKLEVNFRSNKKILKWLNNYYYVDTN